MNLPYGSICTGYDGLGMALRLADVPVVPSWMAENEPSMVELLKWMMPEVPNVGDVKAAPWALAPRVAIMSSGDPCQSISIAGRQAGREDPRFLWPWVRDAYRLVRPDVLFFENVSNIVAHDGGRTLRERFEHLREDGYEVRWCVLGACAVGAPHHRHRWYAVAARWSGPGPVPEPVRVGGTRQICGAPKTGGRFLLPTPVARDGDLRNEGDRAYWMRKGKPNAEGAPLGAVVNLLPTPDASMGTRGGLLSPAKAEERLANPERSNNLDDAAGALSDRFPLLPTPTSRDGMSGAGSSDKREGGDNLRTVATLLPTPMADRSGSNVGGGAGRVGEVRYSLDSVQHLLPTPRASDGEKGRGNPGQVYGSGTLPLAGAVARMLPTPTAGDAERGQNSWGSTGSPTLAAAAQPEIWGRYAEAVWLWEQITGQPAPAPVERGPQGSPRLSPELPEWMMGLPAGMLVDRMERAAALRAAGNGVVPLAAAAAWRLLTSYEG